MLRTYTPPRRYSWPADILIVLLVATVVYGLVAFGREWRSDFHPSTEINLSIWALPLYSAYSSIRAITAYLLSLLFTLIVGYAAAKSRWAERILIPVLDILQSIPVLGFLPGLVLGLIALFPRTNIGLELAAIIMIFTGQVWNMTFSFYSSLKSVPGDLNEAASVMGMSWWRKLWRLELPFSAVGLAWNSLMSMAGGWFFLSVCEAFTLGDQQYRLPGLGAYMATAIDAGNTPAMIMGVVAMIFVIVSMDFIFWRPLLAWVHRFRLEEVPGSKPSEPIVQLVIRNSHSWRWFKKLRKKMNRRRRGLQRAVTQRPVGKSPVSSHWNRISLVVLLIIAVPAVLWMVWSLAKLVQFLANIPSATWSQVLVGTSWTLIRVVATLILSSIWAVPVGIWIGMSSRRVRFFQPLIQVLASFPAPMLYPLALALFVKLGIGFDVGSMFLMLLGVQWYVLFNVLAGTMRIPMELQYVTQLMDVRALRRWTTLYLPSIFPALVTGWVTAAGGAWNASIVAEYVAFRGQILTTHGLGAVISVAAAKADFSLLAASLCVMVATVIFLNRTVWAHVYRLAQTRYRMDL